MYFFKKLGEHWCGLHLIFNKDKSENRIFHIDSLGLPIVMKEVVDFINLNLNGTLVCNDLVLQSEESKICGELNVSLVHWLAAGKSFNSFLAAHSCAERNEASIKESFAPLKKRIASNSPAGETLQVCKAAREKTLQDAERSSAPNVEPQQE